MRRRHNNGSNGGGRRGHGGHKYPRQHSGGGDDQGNRPRNTRNAGAAREKYMNMGRDALHAGDRVLAEYYFQHADHYYRLLLEDGYNPNQRQEINPQQTQPQGQATTVEGDATASGALPAFITTPVAATARDTGGE